MGEQICETYDCCVNEKGLDFCYRCPDFPCSKLAPCADRATEIPHNTKIYNLLLIQKEGVTSLVEAADNLWRQYFRGKKVRAGAEPRLWFTEVATAGIKGDNKRWERGAFV